MTDASLAGYSRARSITVDHTKVGAADLTDFPLLVFFNADNVIGAAIDSAGHGLRFVPSGVYAPNADNSGTTLTSIYYHERNAAASLSGGNFTERAWVKVTTLDHSTDTVVWCLYANNSTEGSDFSGNSWNSSYAAVWHLEQDPSGSAPQMTDSTANAVSGTSAGSMTSGDLVAAKIDNGLDMDGSNDAISFGDPAALALSAITVEAMIYPTSFADYRVIVAKASSDSTSRNFDFDIDITTGKLRFYFTDSPGNYRGITGTAGLSLNTWSHVAATYDGTNIRLFINGSLDTTSGSLVFTPDAGNSQTAAIGRMGGQLANYFLGVLDEVRISNTRLTDDTLSFRYHNVFDAGNCLTFASEIRYVNFAASASSGDQVASASYSYNITVPAHAEDRFLVVSVSLLSVAGTTVTGITHDSVPMTLIGVQSSVSGACRVELWGIVAPATGTKSIAVSLSASVESASHAQCLCGVDQSTPTEGFAGAQATNVGAADALITVTTVAASDGIVSAVATDDTSITPEANIRDSTVTGGTLGSGGQQWSGPYSTPGAYGDLFSGIGAGKTWAIAGVGVRKVTGAVATAFPISISYSVDPILMVWNWDGLI